MSIPSHARSNFQTLLRAAGDGNLALMECLDAYLPPDPDDPEGFVRPETGEAP